MEFPEPCGSLKLLAARRGGCACSEKAERERGNGRMGTQACRGGGEEVVVFEPAPVFLVEWRCSETWPWH